MSNMRHNLKYWTLLGNLKHWTIACRASNDLALSSQGDLQHSGVRIGCPKEVMKKLDYLKAQKYLSRCRLETHDELKYNNTKRAPRRANKRLYMTSTMQANRLGSKGSNKEVGAI
jgi:hypothetical protein